MLVSIGFLSISQSHAIMKSTLSAFLNSKKWLGPNFCHESRKYLSKSSNLDTLLQLHRSDWRADVMGGVYKHA